MKPSSTLQVSFLNQLMYRLIIRIASLISLQLDTNKLIMLLILKKGSSGHQFYDENLPWDYSKILLSRSDSLMQINSLDY